MPRIKVDLPERFAFRTEVQIQEAHLHRGIHLGNASLFSLINDARMAFFESLGYSEVDVEGAGTIMSDALVAYLSESFLGDVLALEVTAGEFSRVGCVLFYRVTNALTGAEVARARTGVVFLDYATRKVQPVPAGFKGRF